MGLPIEYSIDNGQNWQGGGNFTGLNDGVYMVIVRNTNGTCATNYINNPVILNSNSGPVITNITSTNPTSCGANDGTITATATAPVINCDCSGKMTEVTVRYNGSSNTTLTVKNKSQSQLGTINVIPNEVIILKSSDYGLSDWDTKFFLEYGGTDYEFHTSCSDDLAEMNAAVNPQFTVLSYVDGSGNFCNQGSSGCADCNGKMTEVTVQFNGSSNTALIVKNKSNNQIGTLSVTPSQILTLIKSSSYGLSDWDTKFFLTYNGADYEFHTSCSDDLAEMNAEVNPDFSVLS